MTSSIRSGSAMHRSMGMSMEIPSKAYMAVPK